MIIEQKTTYSQYIQIVVLSVLTEGCGSWPPLAVPGAGCCCCPRWPLGWGVEAPPPAAPAPAPPPAPPPAPLPPGDFACGELLVVLQQSNVISYCCIIDVMLWMCVVLIGGVLNVNQMVVNAVEIRINGNQLDFGYLV